MNNKKLRQLLHWLVTIGTGLLAFYLSGELYFQESPLFGVLFLAEVVIALTLSTLYYFFFVSCMKALGKFINQWVIRTMREAVSSVLEDFGERFERRTLQKLSSEDKDNKKDDSPAVYYDSARPVVLDTSAIIDGRVVDLLVSGFLEGKVLIPDVVIDELKHIADSDDKLRKSRGRRGLELLDKLKNGYKKLEIIDNKSTSFENVDKDIIKFAQEVDGRLATTDLNLNKMASVKKIAVINVNDLGNLLKTPLLPGDEVEIELVQKGKEKSQGVGYLDDGSMVVVEGGSKFIGKQIKVCVLRYLQTQAGRMYFGEPLENSD